MTCLSNVTCYNVVSDMPVFANTRHLFSKARPILVWFLEAEEATQEFGVVLHSLWSLWKSFENRVHFWVILFWGCGGHRNTFSEASSRNEGFVWPGAASDRPQGLSTEREQCLKVNNAWHILRSPTISCPFLFCQLLFMAKKETILLQLFQWEEFNKDFKTFSIQMTEMPQRRKTGVCI